MDADQRLAIALRLQLEERDAAIAAGARRVGWKLGVGESERIGAGPVLGHLTSATQIEAGGSVRVGAYAAVRADVEIAVRFARDVDLDNDVRDAIGGYASALEIVDLGEADDPPEAIVATNIFHRAFALGPARDDLPAGLSGGLVVNGELRASAPAADLTERLQRAAQILATLGERLRAGDWIITGSIVQEPVGPGDEATADIGPLGAVTLELAE